MSLQIHLRAGDTGLPEGSSILVGFPHHYYATRCPGPRWLRAGRLPDEDELPPSEAHGSLEASILSDRFAGWHLSFELSHGLEPGASAVLSLPERAAPASASTDFEPLILLRKGPEEPWQQLNTDRPLHIEPGPPTRLQITAASVLVPGTPVQVKLCLLDALGNPTGSLPATITTAQQRSISVQQGAQVSCGTVVLPSFSEPGVHQVELHASVGATRFQARSEPILVEDVPYQLIWADLHGHSDISDGRGSAASYYGYARDVAHLDVAALSDHDWQSEAHEIQLSLSAAEAHNARGHFVTIPSIETNIFGHEIAYFFEPERLSALKPGVRAPPQRSLIGGKPASSYFDPNLLKKLHPGSGHALTIWEEHLLGLSAAEPAPTARALLKRHGERGLITASHSTLSPGMGSAFPLPEKLPGYDLIEIYSAHGSSECVDCERAPLQDVGESTGSVRQALEHHAPLGFIAASDSHDGQPGRSNWGAHSGGLTGLWVTELSREGVREALKNRRVFATTGQRSLIQFESRGLPMGSVLPPTSGPRTLRLRVLSSRPIRELQVIRNGEVWRKFTKIEQASWLQLEDEKPSTARYYYLKIVFSDGALAWSSPLFAQEAVYP